MRSAGRCLISSQQSPSDPTVCVLLFSPRMVATNLAALKRCDETSGTGTKRSMLSLRPDLVISARQVVI